MAKGCETQKGHKPRQDSGFYTRYMSGEGLDVGYAGYVGEPEPVLPNAIGVDVDYPGYDGKTLPFGNETQDFVFAGHVLEHVEWPVSAITEWFRVVRVGGYLVLVVPHQWLYERKKDLPSRFCADHKRFYTPAALLREIEHALPVNHYRIVHFRDVDDGFNYARPHAVDPEWWTERFEMECVLQKIEPPLWNLE